MQHRNTACRGFTLTELLAMVAILVMAALLLPALVRPPHRHYVSCVNNLKQIGLSFKCWALDNADQFPMQVSVTNGGTMELVSKGKVFPHFLVMSNELSTPKVLFCPFDRERAKTAANVFSLPAVVAPGPGLPGYRPLTNDHSVSYFVALDARDDTPNRVLAGDRTLEISKSPIKSGLQVVTTNAVLSWNKWSHAPDQKGQGALLMADGSVQSGRNPQRILSATNLPTVLAVP